MSMLNLLPSNLQLKLSILRQQLAFITKRAYIVGGAVRDLCLGISPKELDIEIFDLDFKEFEKLAISLGAIGVGKSFFVFKWGDIDLSLPRKEKKIGVGHSAFEVELTNDEKEASSRRDFKMNALMLNIFDGKVLDFWGGIDDIKNRQIRIINKDRFIEDSLRVLRAIQFSARFGFKIPKDECSFMKEIDLSDLSHVRIFWELEKMFNAKYLHFGLYYFFALDIARKIFLLEISKKEFLKIALDLAKNINKHEESNRPFIFLYTLLKMLHLKNNQIFDRLQFPNLYQKRLKDQKRVPKNITDRFLVALSLKYPIKEWLGNYKMDIRKRAMDLGIYETNYNGGIFARDVAKEGFVGAEIAKETRRRLLNSIRRNFK